MKINDQLQELYAQASRAYKKPVIVKIDGPIEEAQPIASLENTAQQVQVGDYIVTGVRGERYPIGPAVFADYEPVLEKPGFYMKKKLYIHVYQVDMSGEIETAQGSILYFEPGYYIVMQSPTDAWAVAQEIFEETYVIE